MALSSIWAESTDLLHVSDMSYGNVTHPSAVVQVGDQVTVKVLKFDRDKGANFARPEADAPDPWENIDEHYPMQSRVDGPRGQRDGLRRFR